MSTMSKAAATLLAAMLYAGTASAHAELESSQPAAGSAATSPTQVTITFNEAVIPQFSGIEVKDRTGKVMPTGRSAIDPTNKKVLVVPVTEPLAPGDYKVEWHAVANDTHRVKGSFSFSVTP